jgi:hypothetical protein
VIKELDIVVLLRDMEDYGLKRGNMGTAVHVYKDNAAYEAEFVGGNGKTVASFTLTSEDVRPNYEVSDLGYVGDGRTGGS